jgi:hypothetical protein
MYWLVVSTPLENMKVSWDDEIPNIWKNEIHVPNLLMFSKEISAILGVPDASQAATVCLATAVDQMLRRWCGGRCFT